MSETVARPMVDMPDRIAHLPRDKRGYPVPKFVEWIDGEPDFRVIRVRWLHDCVKHNKCWLCGGFLGRNLSFCIGPMCAVNRVNSEPPSHYACARFAARNCPFLTHPMAKRNERNLPEGMREMPGIPLKRNPGVACIWTTRSYKVEREGPGVLFRVGAAEHVEFWCEGRPATLAEVEASVASGLPALMDTAVRFDGPAGVKELERLVAAFNRLLDETFNEGTGTMQ